MSQFSTTPRKLRVTWNRVYKNRSSIVIEKAVNLKVESRLEKLSRQDEIYAVPLDLSFDWTTPSIVTDVTTGLEVGATASFRAELINVHRDMISAIRPVMVRRFGNAGSFTGGSLNASTSLSENILLSIDPDTTEGDLQTVYVDACARLTDNSGVQGDIQFKLILYLINPKLYI